MSQLLRLSISILLLNIAVPANSADCGLCAKKVVIVPTTAPCLRSALDAPDGKGGEYLTFDLSKCETAVASRGIVPGLPATEDLSKKPTVRFVLPKAKLACLRERFAATESKLDPFAVIDVADCP